ncbi:hypothetical protein OIU77_031041 [Salix suchowensis]|uniref:Secreted protein n=1 Tax=Salix suchowensis TaxID=1278906 RepID=A0ABQ9BHN4_9ROSI|nr:hypothetical protein OIU77_031041 [Salix suchowensis]
MSLKAAHSVGRSEKLLQCWTLMFCFILAHKNGPTFRPKVVQMGGKQQFPYMVCHFSFYYCSPVTTCT